MKKTIVNIAAVLIISSVSFIACKDFMKPNKNNTAIDSTSTTVKDSLSVQNPTDSIQASEIKDSVEVKSTGK